MDCSCIQTLHVDFYTYTTTEIIHSAHRNIDSTSLIIQPPMEYKITLTLDLHVHIAMFEEDNNPAGAHLPRWVCRGDSPDSNGLTPSHIATRITEWS